MMLASQVQSEYEALSSERPRNRLQAPMLIGLLNERKSATSEKDLERIAERYRMDLEKLKSVSMHVSSPTIVSQSIKKTAGGEQVFMPVSCLFKKCDTFVLFKTNTQSQAVWIEPKFS
jgi:hypothetical protein